MKHFFILNQDGEDAQGKLRYMVNGYKKEDDDVVFRPMKKKDWRNKIQSGTFYAKSGKMKFLDVEVIGLQNFLKRRFDNSEFVIISED